MRALDRLILTEILGPFVFSLLLFTSLFFAGSEMLRIIAFLGQGAPPLLVGRLIVLTVPYLVGLTLPMAMLLGVLLGFGRLSGDSEITALSAAGISFPRLTVPVAVFAACLSLLSFWFADRVIPAANQAREKIINDLKGGGLGYGSLLPGFTLPIQQGERLTVVRIQGGLDLQTKSLRNVAVEQWESNRLVGIFYGERADWVPFTNNWVLHQGWMALATGDTLGQAQYLATPLKTLRLREDLGTPESLANFGRPPAEVSIARLQQRAQSLRTKGAAAREEMRAAEVEIGRRIALSLSVLIFALVAAPLAVRPQRGGGRGMGFGLAILIIFLYYVLFQFLTLLAQSGQIPALIGVNLPNIIGLFVAGYLSRRVLR